MSRFRENYSEEDKAIDNKLKAESRVSKLLMSAHLTGAVNDYQDFEEIDRQMGGLRQGNSQSDCIDFGVFNKKYSWIKL